MSVNLLSASLTPFPPFPSRYGQSDELISLAASIVGFAPPTYQQVALLHDWVHQQVRNEQGTSNSFTTVLETLNTSRDFAHLGIALCRAINVPARMVVGFLHAWYPMDLHAWFEAFIGGRWPPMIARAAIASSSPMVAMRPMWPWPRCLETSPGRACR